jgi:hypothetical protein
MFQKKKIACILFFGFEKQRHEILLWYIYIYIYIYFKFFTMLIKKLYKIFKVHVLRVIIYIYNLHHCC